MDKFVTLLKSGGLLAIPTDTVYGLAADATNCQAVANIYALKGRPNFNPLIIHVNSLQTAIKFGRFNDSALSLAQYFWPPSPYAAPLTIVVPIKEKSSISKLALAGLETVALRVPNHPLTLNLLEKCKTPIAAPSANPSNYISPTTSTHVKRMFPKLPVLDGGACKIGLESTVIGCFGSEIILFRAGAVTPEDIKSVVSSNIKFPEKSNHTASPGLLKLHYAPFTPLAMNVTDPRKDDVYIGFGDYKSEMNLSKTGDLKEAAANLFNFLHQADLKNANRITVAPIPDVGIGQAINERLLKASHDTIFHK